jgi:hypothetical protein
LAKALLKLEAMPRFEAGLATLRGELRRDARNEALRHNKRRGHKL